MTRLDLSLCRNQSFRGTTPLLPSAGKMLHE
jgi:hypothetical protein